ncbi:HAD family hydrolase [Ktedonobacter robiniae]|uniref:Haloacid dehalogenase n=1 Tax=Ktedonobacter robiniae TaxID=2778365 RepID=A0ABQ3UYR2_9CHLR|nr:HAD family hydrolase [Ktedonobacter robiniae]GHO57492.1 hypothetical protein KSB_59670 [Ktedonobacter robiniae]
MSLQVVFFDLYETLITEYTSPRQSLASTAALLGVDTQSLDREWRARHYSRMVGHYPDVASVLREICHALDHTIDERVICALEQERQATKALPFKHIDHALLEGLREIRKTGVMLGVISNCAPEEAMGWSTSPLAPFFDDYVFSYQVGYAKPDPHIYRLACKRMAIEPEQAIFIGDGGSGELEGAARLGMCAYRAAWFCDLWPDEWPSYYPDMTGYPLLRSFGDACSLVKEKYTAEC